MLEKNTCEGSPLLSCPNLIRLQLELSRNMIPNPRRPSLTCKLLQLLFEWKEAAARLSTIVSGELMRFFFCFSCRDRKLVSSCRASLLQKGKFPSSTAHRKQVSTRKRADWAVAAGCFRDIIKYSPP